MILFYNTTYTKEKFDNYLAVNCSQQIFYDCYMVNAMRNVKARVASKIVSG